MSVAANLLWTGLYDAPAPGQDIAHVRNALVCNVVPSYEAQTLQLLSSTDQDFISSIIISVMHPFPQLSSFPPLLSFLSHIRAVRPSTAIFVLPQAQQASQTQARSSLTQSSYLQQPQQQSQQSQASVPQAAPPAYSYQSVPANQNGVGGSVAAGHTFGNVFYVASAAGLVERLSLTVARRIAHNEVLWPDIGSKVCSANSKMYYTIGKRLGEGAYSVVHECVDFFEQPFVLKIIKPQRSRQQVEDDWKREKDFLASVLHPNVIQMHDYFMHNNLFYYVLEHAEGSLRDLLETPPQRKT